MWGFCFGTVGSLPGPIRSVLSWLERQDFWVSVSDAPFAYLPVCLGLVGFALSQSGLSTLVHGASCKGAFVQCAWYVPGVLAGVGLWLYKDACGWARKNGVKGHQPHTLKIRV